MPDSSESRAGAGAGAGNDFVLRQATANDSDALAALHVLVWRDTYRLLAPKAARDALDEAKRKQHWDELILRDRVSLTLVAEQNGRLVGLGHAGPGTHEVMTGAGEIVHLYVDPANQGQGSAEHCFVHLRNF